MPLRSAAPATPPWDALVTANHKSCRRQWLTTKKANRHSNVRVGTRQRSIATIASAWLRRNVRHVCDGGPPCLIMYLETVDSATSKPSLELAVDARGAPQRVLFAHLPDKVAQFTIDLRPSCPMAGFPAPERSEACAMPAQDCLRLHHLGQVKQIRPNPRDPHQERPVTPVQPQTKRRPTQGYVELITEKQILDFEPVLRLEQVDDEHCQQMKDRKHHLE